MTAFKRYTITAALPYTNGPIHIGHLAGVYVPSDIYARFLRAQGKDVAFICGSDEHGVAISIKAKLEGITPKEVIDKYHHLIINSFNEFGISFDNYSRTSAKIHFDTASEFFKKLHQSGKFIEETTAQFFDEQAQQFLADRFIVGTCPKCHHEEAYGDQCEKCGTSLNATDLVNPKSTITGNKPVLRQTKHWFLPLDAYSSFLKSWILDGHKNDWKPNVYGQVKSWIDDGLKPRAVTRDLDWGIPVPLDNAEGKVLYVWFDAPIGYISATKEWAQKEGKDWEPYWKDSQTKLVHFIGKDNIVFHCIIFPAMLKAEGSFILPDNVPANEFLNLEGQKLSTSKNWAVWLHEYLNNFPNQQDVLRYVLTSNAPETKDNDFTWKDFQARNNNELVAIYGNFINRVITLVHKYFSGTVPEPGDYSNPDQEFLDKLNAYPSIIADSIERYRFREGLTELMNIARLGNKYLADEEPWKVIKNDPERVKTQLFIALQAAGLLAILSEPFLPFTAGKLRQMLAISSAPVWRDLCNLHPVKPGTNLGQAILLFEKIEDDIIDREVNKLSAQIPAKTMKNIPAPKDLINFEEFSKTDIRIGTIVNAEKMPKADKLLVLKVDVGTDVRTIVSGIAEYFSPEEVIGKSVAVLTNLAPRNLRGVESQGMILLAATPEGKLTFVVPEENTSNGAVIS